MLIFGAGPDMKEYMHKMYNEYYNTWQINRDRTLSNGCTSRVADQLQKYAEKFQDPESETHFKYAAPKESDLPKGQALPGSFACSIRSAGHNYGRRYLNTYLSPSWVEKNNDYIRSCAVRDRGSMRNLNRGNFYDETQGWQKGSWNKGPWGMHNYTFPTKYWNTTTNQYELLPAKYTEDYLKQNPTYFSYNVPCTRRS